MNYQKLILIGNVTRDAQRRTSTDGSVTFTTLRVAVSDHRERTVFFPVTVFGKQAETVAEYVTKGRQVLVEGHIEEANNGRMNVVAERVVFGNGLSAAKEEKVEPQQSREQSRQSIDS